MKLTKSQLFKRQTTLKEIGEEGQQKLQNASVLVIGCGGLGSAVAVYLATSGVGKIHLVDFDNVDISNLHRQVFFEIVDVGKPKAETLAKFIKKRAPFTEVAFSNKAVTKESIFGLISTIDIVVDATDSLPTKYLINDACVIKQKPLVYGSLYKFDGYVSTFNVKQKDGSFSANLRDAFPEMVTDIPNCEEAGTLNAIVGLIALAQVNEVSKLITGVGKPLINELLIYNSLENHQLKMKLKPNFDKEKIKTIFEKETYFDANCAVQNPNWLISADELRKRLSFRALSNETEFYEDSLRSKARNLYLISVLPNLKTPFSVDEVIPINSFDIESIEIDNSKTYIMVCQKGLNSYKATEILKQEYPNLEVFSLKGGINSYN